MGIFITNGFPNPSATLPLLHAIDAAGADFIELGMPFSDPLAEGLPIQQASEVALRHGIRMKDTLETAAKFRAKSDTPLLLMGYMNPIFRYGVSNFCRDAHSSGVDGLILPDLPPEESELIKEAAETHKLGLVFLIAPNTPDARIQATDALSTAFVYAVSMTGLTGAKINQMDATASYLQHARTIVKHRPLMVGFGIKSYADAQRLSLHTDGFIVGSAVINLVARLWQDETLTDEARLNQVTNFVQSLKQDASELKAPA